jgi:hypothetical protein
VRRVRSELGTHLNKHESRYRKVALVREMIPCSAGSALRGTSLHRNEYDTQDSRILELVMVRSPNGCTGW